MTKPYTPEDIQDIKGFEAGCDYIVAEIERYIEVYPSKEFVLHELLAHLKMEDAPK